MTLHPIRPESSPDLNPVGESSTVYELKLGPSAFRTFQVVFFTVLIAGLTIVIAISGGAWQSAALVLVPFLPFLWWDWYASRVAVTKVEPTDQTIVLRSRNGTREIPYSSLRLSESKWPSLLPTVLKDAHTGSKFYLFNTISNFDELLLVLRLRCGA